MENGQKTPENEENETSGRKYHIQGNKTKPVTKTINRKRGNIEVREMEISDNFLGL